MDNHDTEYAREDMIWRERALEIVLDARTDTLATHSQSSVPLEEIPGRVLAEPIVAQRDVPAHDHATMDGYAFDATDAYPLSLRDIEVYPEDDPPSLAAGEAVEIATGAPLPPEANAVLKREESSVEDGRLSGSSIDPGTYTYEQGSNVSAGETVFEQGERLAAKDAIFLGDLGYETVAVSDSFSAGVLATGTEIHEGQIDDLDSEMLVGLVRSWGHDATYEGSVPDEYDQVRDTIASLASNHDVVITTGGTSVGHKDYVIRALADLGAVEFHRVRIRPGKPIALARLPEYDASAFAIPGKPIGAYTVATMVMGPFFTGATDLPGLDATFTQTVDIGAEGFEYAIPVVLENDEEEGRRAVPLGHSSSRLDVYEDVYDPSVLSSSTRASRADGVVLTRTGLEAGQDVAVIPYEVFE